MLVYVARMTHDALHDTVVSDGVLMIRERYERVAVAASAAGVLYWDERAMLPPAASAWRTQQRAWIAGAAHRELLDPDLTALVARVLDADPTHPEALAVHRDIAIATRVPAAWTEQYAAATARAWSAWTMARSTPGRISEYLAALGSVVELARERAELLTYPSEPYDALISEWEPGMTAAVVVDMIEDVVHATSSLRSAVPIAEHSVLDRNADPDAKQRYEAALAAALGFDAAHGRIDPALRAFCIPLGPHDVRLTSRFGVTPGLRSLNSGMHEVGHAIYAQAFARLGVPGPLAREASVGIDESQSRMFETHVGLHPGFLRFMLASAHEYLGDVVNGIDVEEWVAAWTARIGSALRVGSDELDYDAHILLRARLERMLINGDLEADNLPEAWREQAAQLLPHLPCKDHLHGVLQDVHWSIGQFGYFPCYTLGNIYAAQMMRAARRDISTLDEELTQGSTASLRGWLDDVVYQHGRSRSATQIMQLIDGDIDPSAHIAHITARFAPVPDDAVTG